MKDLVLIPARGGSKGIPGKNIKPLHGRPLIYYTLDAACAVAAPENICVSTDSDEIIGIVRAYGLDVPFRRPDDLSTDTASSHDVVIHALNFYEQRGIRYDRVVLLQPTSPFRTGAHIREAISLYRPELDMVVSVKIAKGNPYFTLFEETHDGFLVQSKPASFVCRQDCPPVFEYNGAIYVINGQSMKNGIAGGLSKTKKYLMTEEDSLDIDSNIDWIVAEAIISDKLIRKDL
ncbi:MAG: acylneuraminate cytidylyltransferase family protein [Syntrophorhabdaceae bacterium]